MQDLKALLKGEKEKKTRVYPPEEKIFAAFQHTPFHEVRVVIVGQDPYHGAMQAEGLCFSVAPGVDKPPSLKNIDMEVLRDLSIPVPKTGSLLSWAHEGVLLLNTFLTVREGQPLSHKNFGWDRFTDAVIHQIALKKDPIVFMLWGNFAQKKCKPFLQGNHPHLVLRAAHPSPFSVKGFLGCSHFSKANAFLLQNGKKEINWNRE